MTEDVKLIVDTLRYCEESGARCGGCPSGHDEKGIPRCHSQSHIADLIESLSAQNEELLQKIEHLKKQFEQVTRERDAAMADVKSLCSTNYFSGNFCHYCKYNEPDGQCHHHCIPYSSEWGWEWRGVEVEG